MTNPPDLHGHSPVPELRMLGDLVYFLVDQ